ncbi:zinc finger CCCH domain-containing protein 13-like isoform X2 [Mya arenaria]|uniref:zinc finger CCCH domain-containing protein 13-like isoform X2 n=1 Tax=Mya arenaria TaxID=6604 RepID=UPI0022E26228|nr:zinc finger CCCH domain-containing protein 13-like isoform X2 [Mya arenaria]
MIHNRPMNNAQGLLGQRPQLGPTQGYGQPHPQGRGQTGPRGPHFGQANQAIGRRPGGNEGLLGRAPAENQRRVSISQSSQSLLETPASSLAGNIPHSRPYEPQSIHQALSSQSHNKPTAQMGYNQAGHYQQQQQHQHHASAGLPADSNYYEADMPEEQYGETPYDQDPYAEQAYAEQQYEAPAYAEPEETYPELYAEPETGYYEEDMRAGLMEYAAEQVQEPTVEDYAAHTPYAEEQYVAPGPRPGPSQRNQGRMRPETVEESADYVPYNRQDQQFGNSRSGPQNQLGGKQLQQQYGGHQQQQQQHQPKSLLGAPPHMRSQTQKTPIQHRMKLEAPGTFGHPQQQHPSGAGMMEAHDHRNQGRGLLDTPDVHGHRDGLLQSPEPRRGGRGLLEHLPMQPPVKPEILQPGSGDRGPRSNERERRGGSRNSRWQPNEEEGSNITEQMERASRLMDRGRGRDRGVGQEIGRGQERGRGSKQNEQIDLLSKASIQMQLLEEEKARMVDIEQQERIMMMQQQQALIVQQQQAQLLQQQQLFQQQQQAQSLLGMPGSGSGNIPSLLDMSTSRGVQSQLGKRPGMPAMAVDNKRPKVKHDVRSRDRQTSSRDKDRSNDIRRRSPDRSRDRRSRPRHSPVSATNKPRDRKDSGRDSRRGSHQGSNRDRGRNDKKSADDKKKSDKNTGKPSDKKEDRKSAGSGKTGSTVDNKMRVTMEITEEYDPANPTEGVIPMQTGDAEVKQEPSTVKEKDSGIKAEAVAAKTPAENKENPAKEGVKDDKGDNSDKDEKKGDKSDTGKEDKQDISLTVTVNKKGRSVNDSDKDSDSKSKKKRMYTCQVCTIDCFDMESFSRHMSGQKHRTNMSVVTMAQASTLDLAKSRSLAEEHLRQIEGSKTTRKEPSKVKDNHCRTCDKKYIGAFKEHKMTPEHKARDDRAKAGCKICKVTSFSGFPDLRKHLESAWHRKNKRALKSEDQEKDELADLVTLDTVGFDDDAAGDGKKTKSANKDSMNEAVKSPSAPSTPTTSSTSSVPSAPSVPSTPSAPSVSSTPQKTEEELEMPGDYEATVCYGQSFIVPVYGFFCKVCSKFYNNEQAAKVTHCQSKPHYEKVKTAIAKKLNAKKAKATPAKTSTSDNSANQSETNSRRESRAESSNEDQAGKSNEEAQDGESNTKNETSGNSKEALNGEDKEAAEGEKTPTEGIETNEEGSKDGSTGTEGEKSDNPDNTDTPEQKEDNKPDEESNPGETTMDKGGDEETAGEDMEKNEEESGETMEDGESQEMFVNVSEKSSTPKAKRGGASGRGPRARRGRKNN